MKIILVILSVFILANCSSSSKKEKGPPPEKTMFKKNRSQPQSQTDLTQSMGKATSVKCQLSKDKRMVSLEKVRNGCQVVYKKFGKTKTLGRSRSGTTHCKQIMKRILANLSGAGFTCK